MDHRTLGRTGLSVSILGFGGTEIGFEAASQEIVEALLECGPKDHLQPPNLGEQEGNPTWHSLPQGEAPERMGRRRG